MIRVIDYGLGNIQAFLNAFSLLGIDADRAKAPSDIEEATHLILPGVGSFDLAMQLFLNSGMRDAVESSVLEAGTPVLGVCVGMQMMASSSEEGNMPGLDWIPGKVRKIQSTFDGKYLQTPHMGWNEAIASKPNPILSYVKSPAEFYFLHSFYFSPDNEDDILANFCHFYISYPR